MHIKRPSSSKTIEIQTGGVELVESLPSENDDFQQELARLVAEQRRRRGWTHAQLAKEADLPVKTIRSVEGGSAKRLYLRPGLRLLRVLGLRLRLVPLQPTSSKEIARRKKMVRSG